MMAKIGVDVERDEKSQKMCEKAWKGVDQHGKAWKGVNRHGKAQKGVELPRISLRRGKAWIHDYAFDKC